MEEGILNNIEIDDSVETYGNIVESSDIDKNGVRIRDNGFNKKTLVR